MLGQLSSHLVRTHRHLRYGPAITNIEETLLMLSGTAAELQEIRAISLAGRNIRFDHGTRTAHHEHHSDPAILFEADGRHNLQVFFHDLAPKRDMAALVIELHGGRAVTLPCSWPEPEKLPVFRSELIAGMTYEPRLEIECDEAVEVIFQRLAFGRIVEERHEVDAGEHEIALPPAFADAYGVAVSTAGLMHGIEHKHVVLGKFGAPSGRYLLAEGETYSHGIEEDFAYRAAVAVADGAGRPGGLTDPWIGFDEVDVWCRPDQADEIRNLMLGCPVPWRVTTYGSEADVLLLSLDQTPPPDHPSSYMLFESAESPGFRDQVVRLMEHQQNFADDHRCIDSQWLTADRPPANDRRRYGIAFSTPTEGNALKARVEAFKAAKLGVGFALAASLPLP